MNFNVRWMSTASSIMKAIFNINNIRVKRASCSYNLYRFGMRVYVNVLFFFYFISLFWFKIYPYEVING